MSRCWSRRGGCAAVFGACVALWDHEAAADEVTPQLNLVYRAPAECPSQAELEEQLRTRVPASWLSRRDARRFEVDVVREEDGHYVGRLEVHSTSREPHVREIRASTCAAVSTSLAVFLALALDPAAEEEPPAAPRTGAGKPSPPRPSPAPASSWIWSSGLHTRHLRAPEPAWGSRVHAELARSAGKGTIMPSARLSWGWSNFSVPAALAGEASFRLRSARLEACARIALPSSFEVSPCAAFDVGMLSGGAPELRGAKTETTGWSAGGAVLRGRWSLSELVAIEVDATLLAPLERTSFELREPLRTVYRPPRVLFEGGAGACVSVRFH